MGAYCALYNGQWSLIVRIPRCHESCRELQRPKQNCWMWVVEFSISQFTFITTTWPMTLSVHDNPHSCMIQFRSSHIFHAIIDYLWIRQINCQVVKRLTVRLERMSAFVTRWQQFSRPLRDLFIFLLHRSTRSDQSSFWTSSCCSCFAERHSSDMWQPSSECVVCLSSEHCWYSPSLKTR
jgi:hypothetical protein